MFRKRYVAFLNELSALAREHDELTDTDVRERLFEVLNWYFVWDKPVSGFPRRFAMMSTAGDRVLASAVKKFVVDARKLADEVEPGAARHALLQDDSAKTRRRERFDVFLGSSDRPLKARKPSPDSLYARSSARKRKLARPKHDPKSLAIKFKGKRIIPTFHAETGQYTYTTRSCSCGFSQDHFSAAEIRKQALDELNDPF
jgi:hypothetical protein